MDELVGLGATATFSVYCDRDNPVDLPMAVQWVALGEWHQYGDGILDGVTNATLTITNVQPG